MKIAIIGEEGINMLQAVSRYSDSTHAYRLDGANDYVDDELSRRKAEIIRSIHQNDFDLVIAFPHLETLEDAPDCYTPEDERRAEIEEEAIGWFHGLMSLSVRRVCVFVPPWCSRYPFAANGDPSMTLTVHDQASGIKYVWHAFTRGLPKCDASPIRSYKPSERYRLAHGEERQRRTIPLSTCVVLADWWMFHFKSNSQAANVFTLEETPATEPENE